MKLSVIIPVLNEKETLSGVLDGVLAVEAGCEKEIIIVDDGSTDGSTEIIKKYSEKKPKLIKTIYRGKPGGKGNAIREAVPLVTGDIIIIQDADHEYDIADYPALVKPLINNEADVVFGSRFLGSIENMKPQYMLANKILTLTANLLYGIKITDEATAYKLAKADVFRRFKLESKRFEFCPEFVAKTARTGCRIAEVPVKYRSRTLKEGKKIKLRDAFEAVVTLFKYRFWKG